MFHIFEWNLAFVGTKENTFTGKDEKRMMLMFNTPAYSGQFLPSLS